MGYKNKAIKSISWMSLLQLFTRFISIIKIAIIARILTPFDIGIFGIIVLVIGMTEIFSEFGIQTFLIQYKKNISVYVDSAWVFQLIRGIILFVIILILSFPVSVFFKEKSLIVLLWIAALNPLIKGFENIYVVNFQKELYFNKEFIYRLLVVFSDFIFALLITLIFHSAIGLVGGMLAASCVGIAYTWIAIKEKPSFSFDLKKIKQILHFGKWLNLNSILYYVINVTDSLTIGRFFGPSSLGFYQVGQKFSFTPMQEIADIFGKVSFPVYSKISGDLTRLKNAYFKTLVVLVLIELFIAIFLFIFSKEVILFLLGSKWIQTEQIFKVFIVYGFISSVVGTNGALFLSVGKQDLLTKLNFVRLIVVIFLVPLFVIKFSTVGAIYALVISLLVVLPISGVFTAKLFISKNLFLKIKK
jgi:lipopolysaccharide exporter